MGSSDGICAHREPRAGPALCTLPKGAQRCCPCPGSFPRIPTTPTTNPNTGKALPPPRPCCKPSPWPCNCGTGWAPPAAPGSPRDSATPAWIRPQHRRGALGVCPPQAYKEQNKELRIILGTWQIPGRRLQGDAVAAMFPLPLPAEPSPTAAWAIHEESKAPKWPGFGFPTWNENQSPPPRARGPAQSSPDQQTLGSGTGITRVWTTLVTNNKVMKGKQSRPGPAKLNPAG